MVGAGDRHRALDAHRLRPAPRGGAGLVALFHRFNIFCFGWNLQYPEVLTTGLRMGLDGIFSDWPDRASDALNNLDV